MIPFLLVVGLLLYSIYVIIFDKNVEIDKKFFLVFLISISIVRLMLSYEFWKEISFGMYLYLILSLMQKEIDRRKNGKCNNSNI